MQKKIEIFTITLLFLFAFYCTLNVGISWDDLFHIDLGNRRLKYLLSFGNDYKVITLPADQKFHPGFYYTLIAFLTKMFPKTYEIGILHLANYLFSILTIFGISKISSELFNKKVGKIVFLLCFFNPIIFGHMAIDQNDVIVAFSNIWTTYLIIRYLKNQEINKKRNRYVILAGFTIGLGLSVRIIFLSTLIPIITFFFLDILLLKKLVNKKFVINKLIIDIIKILIIAYIMMISCWPETHENIFILPFKLLIESFDLIIGNPLGLLNGNFYNTVETPKFYLIINLLYKLPEFILLTYLVFVYLILKNKCFFNSKFKFFNTKLILTLFIIIFPNLLLWFSPYKIYDGLRLFLYLIPYISIIPGLAIYYLIINYKNHISKILLTAIFTLSAYYLLIFFSLTPYQYIYLNVLSGDFSEAHKKFENDFWAVSAKELINQIPNNKDLLNNKDLKLAFCGAADDNIKFYLKKIKNFQFRQVNWRNEDYDYIIMTNRIVIPDISEKKMGIYNLTNLKTCFEKFNGIDVITVNRNGLVLSTLRKKI
jgi:hypothetical protein